VAIINLKETNITMKIDEAYPEAYRLARRFHELYEQSAPLFGYETKDETKVFDPESPNGRLMAWVCYEIVKEEKEKMADKIRKSKVWELVPNTPRKIMIGDKELNNLLEDLIN